MRRSKVELWSRQVEHEIGPQGASGFWAKGCDRTSDKKTDEKKIPGHVVSVSVARGLPASSRVASARPLPRDADIHADRLASGTWYAHLGDAHRY